MINQHDGAPNHEKPHDATTKGGSNNNLVDTLGNFTITNTSTTPPSTPPRTSCIVEVSQHDLREQTFHFPTYCSVCQGLLTGLWKQGLQCKVCGITVHAPEHDSSEDDMYECCAKAMLTECKSESQGLSVEEQEQRQYEETVAAVNQELANEADMEESDATKNDAGDEASTCNDESPKQRRRHPKAHACILPQISRLLPNDYAEQAHLFETVTFSEPTYCDICNGALAGLFSQGKQCQKCGLIVHHGKGAENHSNCHAEAMVQPCTVKQDDRNAKSTCSSRDDVAGTTMQKSNQTDTDNEAPSNETGSNTDPKDKKEPSTAATAASFPIQILPSLSSEDQHEIPHKFVEHSYASPTYCSICNGLLVGLWSQGFECQVCGINVHRGEGVDEHDDCKAEALLSPCSGKQVEKEQTVTLTQAIQKSPNFFREVKEQMDKDLMTHVKEAVVAGGVEGERSKNLRRLRESLGPRIEALDAIEAKGEIYCILVLLRIHAIISFIVSGIGLLLFIIALSPKLGFGLLDASVFHLAAMHELTILGTIHICLLALAFILWYYSLLFRRKSVILEEFLVDMFGINAEEDIGISVVGASIRARAWSQRIATSATLTAITSLVAWNYWQPTLDELRRALSQGYVHAQHVVSPDEL